MGEDQKGQAKFAGMMKMLGIDVEQVKELVNFYKTIDGKMSVIGEAILENQSKLDEVLVAVEKLQKDIELIRAKIVEV